jgi:hypothetical protein
MFKRLPSAFLPSRAKDGRSRSLFLNQWCHQVRHPLSSNIQFFGQNISSTFEHKTATGSVCAKQCNETVSERTRPHGWAWWFNLIGDYTSYMYIYIDSSSSSISSITVYHQL